MSYEIEKGIPIRSGSKLKSKYPFAGMEKGDSFVAPEKAVRVAAARYGRRFNMVFATRSVEGGFRVWRVA